MKTINTEFTIRATLGDLIDRLDARALITVYEGDNNPVFNGHVYELLNSNNTDFHYLAKYGKRKVIGLNITIGYVNILIEEA